MTPSHRSELLAAVEMLSQRYPHWRLGQLIANIAGWADHEIWDVEDDQLLAAIRLHLQQPSTSKSPPQVKAG